MSQPAPVPYTDRFGTYNQYIWHVEIENRRPDLGAFLTIARLDWIQVPQGGKTPSPDGSYLKWAYQSGYERTIPPTNSAKFDAFAIDDNPAYNCVYLHSLSDVSPRRCILPQMTGQYTLHYQVFAQGFPLLEFTVELDITGNIATTSAKIV
jgi:hypothetical protein